MEIRKIAIKELEGFIRSEAFRSFPDKPITPMRVASQVNNPRAYPDDIVLYMLFKEKKLVAYRTLVSDFVFLNTEKVRFAWCSGNWVHPGYRRQGFSYMLLNEAYNDWNGKLMFTNYAPASLNLYLKSGLFKEIYRHEGARFYLFPKTRKLIGGRRKILKPVLFFPDSLIYLFMKCRLVFFKEGRAGDYNFIEKKGFDEECLEIAENRKNEYLFLRGKNEFQWIFGYPWISGTDNRFVKDYRFSSYSEDFNYKTVKVGKGGKTEGFFLFSVRDGHLKTLYFFMPELCFPEAASWLTNYCVRNSISYMTVNNSQMGSLLRSSRSPFLRIKEYGQAIYSTFEIKSSEKKKIQDGDGDVVFT